MKQRRQLCAVFILIVLLISLEAPEAAVNKRRRAKSAAKHLAKRLAKAQLQKSKKASKGPKGSKVTQQMNYAAAVSICHAKLKSLPDGGDLCQIRHVAASMAATTGLSYEQTATACMAAKQQLQPATSIAGAGLQQAKVFHQLQQPQQQQQQQQQQQLQSVGDLVYVAAQSASKVTWRGDIGEVLVP